MTKSRHNVDRLLKIATGDLVLFSKQALARRREAEGMTRAQAAEYVADKYEPTLGDFRALRRTVAKQRSIYEQRYRDIRDKIFAHNELSNQVDTNALFKKTSIREMKELLAFLHALHEALWEMFNNGRQPVVQAFEFDLESKIAWQSLKPGEIIGREIVPFLRSTIRP